MAEEGDVIPFRAAPDPRSIESRKLIAMPLHNASGCQRAKLAPARDVKLDAILDCQSVIMRAVAFLLDADLTAAGEAPEIRFMVDVKQGNGEDKSSPLVVP
jgi:hypothetical protein